MGTIDRVILVPGLFEPHFAFLPLQRALRRHCHRVDLFQDRHAFRRIDESIHRLSGTIDEASGPQSVAIVTHSFGDWVARQAIASASHDHVAALVSVAPVMRAGTLFQSVSWFSRGWIPEIGIITDPERASANLDCSRRMRRLVIWAQFDECLRSVPLDHLPNIEVQRVAATHLSVILQPNVLKSIEHFLFRADQADHPRAITPKPN